MEGNRNKRAIAMHRTHRGFTLIELMIVIAIIGILAAIAIPAYQDYVIKSQVAEGIVLADGAKSAVWDFISNTGRYPPSNASAGLVSPSSISSNYISQVNVAPGPITVTFGHKANNQIIGKALLLSPNTGGGSIHWRCYSTSLNSRYLPSSCRD